MRPPSDVAMSAPTPDDRGRGTQARTDFRLHVGCVDHLKVRRLCGQFGDGAFLWLVRLWSYAAENRAHGRLTGIDDADIAAVCMTTAEPGTWVEALLRFRLLDRVGDEVVIHDWAEHQPWIVGAPERSARAREAALARHATKRKPQKTPGAGVEILPTASALHTGAMPLPGPSPSPLPVPVPVPTRYPQPLPVQVPTPEPVPRPPPAASRSPIPDLTGGPPFAPRSPLPALPPEVDEGEGDDGFE